MVLQIRESELAVCILSFLFQLLIFEVPKSNQLVEFAQGKVDPVEAGKKGGHASGGTSDDTEDTSSSGNSGGSKKGGTFSLLILTLRCYLNTATNYP